MNGEAFVHRHAFMYYMYIHIRRVFKVVSYSMDVYIHIYYIVRIRRRPLFYVFNLILPCVLINGIGEFMYRVLIKYCVFSKISKYIPDSGLSRLCTLDFMLGPLNGRQKTSAAAELAELRKITTFKGKNTIFNEHPVSSEVSVRGRILSMRGKKSGKAMLCFLKELELNKRHNKEPA